MVRWKQEPTELNGLHDQYDLLGKERGSEVFSSKDDDREEEVRIWREEKNMWGWDVSEGSLWK